MNGLTNLPKTDLPRDYTKLADLQRAYLKAADGMYAALLEVEEYLDDRADVDDGIPNHAMRLLVVVKEAIGKARP